MRMREVMKMLPKLGWDYVKSEGSHHTFQQRGTNRRRVVAGVPQKDLGPTQLRRLMRQLDLPLEAWREHKHCST